MFAKEGFKYGVFGCKGTAETPAFEFDEIQYNTNVIIGNDYDGEVLTHSMVFPYSAYDHIHIGLVPITEEEEEE
jgi:hypothetical protein